MASTPNVCSDDAPLLPTKPRTCGFCGREHDRFLVDHRGGQLVAHCPTYRQYSHNAPKSEILGAAQEAAEAIDLERRRNHNLPDAINPDHYKGDLVMRIIEHFGLHDSFCLGNVLKYILRHREKNGIEDLKKAAWYLDRAIAEAEGRAPLLNSEPEIRVGEAHAV